VGHSENFIHARLVLQYYFEDRFDLVQFVKVVKDAGLYLMLRIGPFVAAEWNFGCVRLLQFTVWVCSFTCSLSLGFSGVMKDVLTCVCVGFQGRAGVAALHSWNGVPDQQRAIQGGCGL
jgi:hypothetical protein